MILSRLDPMEEARRYLSGHRLMWRVNSRLIVGGSEMILYGGPNRYLHRNHSNGTCAMCFPLCVFSLRGPGNFLLSKAS